jgi:hypothetical protein
MSDASPLTTQRRLDIGVGAAHLIQAITLFTLAD